MPTVGEILAAERRRQGKSLNDVVDGTKIRSRLLDALEQGRYDDLPPQAYVKGYIQSYARYLEIPSGPLLDQLRGEYSESEHGSSPADRYLASIPAETVVPDRDRMHAIPRNVWVIAAAAAVIVLLVVCSLARSLSNSGQQPELPPATGPQTPAASPGASGTVGATQTIGTATGGFRVVVKIRQGEASWVKATIDGQQAYAGTMLGGESKEWQATSSATLVIGKPAAVVVTRDGTAVTVPSAANARVDLSAQQ